MRIFLCILGYILIAFLTLTILRFADPKDERQEAIAAAGTLWPIGIPIIIGTIFVAWLFAWAGMLAEKLRDLKDSAKIIIRKEKYHRTGRPPD